MILLSAPIPLAFLAAVLFGLAMIVSQLGVRKVPTLPGAAVSNLSAAAFFWLAAPFFWDGAHAAALPFAVFVLVGIFFPATVTLLQLEANRRMGPSVTAAISGTTPLFAYLAAVAFLGETLLAGGLIGTMAIVIGVAILVSRKGSMTGGVGSRVIALPIGTAVIRAVAQVLTKYGLALWPSAFAAILIGYTASAAVTGAIVAVRRESIPRAKALGWFVAAGLMNGLGVLAMYVAFRDGDVTVVAPIVATSPLVTLVVSAFVLREEAFGARLVLGIVVTFAGVALILLR